MISLSLSHAQDCSRETESMRENVFKMDKEIFLLKVTVTYQECGEDKPKKTSVSKDQTYPHCQSWYSHYFLWKQTICKYHVKTYFMPAQKSSALSFLGRCQDSASDSTIATSFHILISHPYQYYVL
jgi:hypothetical protein